jgi:hypothetical protein
MVYVLLYRYEFKIFELVVITIKSGHKNRGNKPVWVIMHVCIYMEMSQ